MAGGAEPQRIKTLAEIIAEVNERNRPHHLQEFFDSVFSPRPSNPLVSFQPPPVSRPREWIPHPPEEKLLEIDDEVLAALVRDRLVSRASFSEILGRYVSQAGLTLLFAEATIPQATIELPIKAQKFWVDRSEEDPSNPSEFILKFYAPWLPHTLAQQELQLLDPPLYVAYTSRTRADRHPEERLTFAPKKARSDKLDDAELGRRQREQNTASKAKVKSKRVRTHGPRLA